MDKREKEIKKATKEQNELFARVNDIYHIIGKHDVKIDVSQEDIADHYRDMILEIIQYFLDNDLKNKDIEFLMSDNALMMPIRQVKSVLESAVMKSMEMAQEKKWGKPFGDVSFTEIHNTLKTK